MSRITDAALANMLRHAEIKREAACEMIRDGVDGEVEFSEILGRLELSFWTDLFEMLLELQAWRTAMKVKP